MTHYSYTLLDISGNLCCACVLRTFHSQVLHSLSKVHNETMRNYVQLLVVCSNEVRVRRGSDNDSSGISICGGIRVVQGSGITIEWSV